MNAEIEHLRAQERQDLMEIERLQKQMIDRHLKIKILEAENGERKNDKENH